MTSRKPHGGGRVARPDAWSPDTAWRVAFTLSSAASWTVSSSSRACCPALSTRVIEPLVASCLIRHCPWAACLSGVGGVLPPGGQAGWCVFVPASWEAPCSARPRPAQRPLWLWFQVVFGRTLPAFATIPLHQLQHEKKYDIYFMDGRVFALYR